MSRSLDLVIGRDAGMFIRRMGRSVVPSGDEKRVPDPRGPAKGRPLNPSILRENGASPAFNVTPAQRRPILTGMLLNRRLPLHILLY